MVIARLPKPRKCQNPECGQEFTPRFSSTQKVCSPACALAIKDKHANPARKAIADRERREIKVRKERLKTHSDHIKDAEKAVRDYRRTYELSIGSGCISCGKSQAEVLAEQGWKTGGAFDAGHFLGKGQGPSTAWSHPTYGFNARPVTRAQASTPGRGLPFPRASVRA